MTLNIAVVIPCYRVRHHILDVLQGIGPTVSHIVVVDDACPEMSGKWVQENNQDPRVQVIFHDINRGVGGAVMTGYRTAIESGADILVKIDGDGQMDPALIERFVRPIARGQADYTKGNRFYDLTHLGEMPGLRLIGNAALSFMAKMSTGYWNIFDITNGYTAIHVKVVQLLPLEKISARYFFETDILFRLNLVRALVVDIPMDAKYAGESSSMRIGRIAGEFLWKHVRNFSKRIFYNYFLRDMSVASLELLIGLSMLLFGVVFGVSQWLHSWQSGIGAPLGTVMLAALPTMLGIQFLLAFIGFDVANTPRRAVHPDLA
ncbi:MAG: glycosyltransferase family 2 protein [Betaproteobacteria bacterium]|jgi:glycosyltransferase involved in cell wall biosynthesis